MDPFIGGALISGATSLLGGLFGRKQAKDDLAMQRQLINEQNEYNNPTNIRKRAEEGGFNPLSFIGPGVGLQTQTAQVNSGNYMGAAIADAGMAMADAMSKKAELGRLDKLSQANAKLQAKVQSLTLRPKVGGVYAQRQSTPTIAAAVGVSDAASSTVVSGGRASGRGDVGADAVDLRPLSESLPVDPRRGVDNSKITTTSGVMVLDNPHLPFALNVPTLDGDEPLQWYDYPSLVLPAIDGAIRAYSSDGPYLGLSGSVDRVPRPTAAQTAYLKANRSKWAARWARPSIGNYYTATHAGPLAGFK